MKTTSEILSEHAAKANNNAIFDYADSWINGAMQEFADQEKQALKEKIYNHVVSKLAEYERDDDGDPWYNGAITEMDLLKTFIESL